MMRSFDDPVYKSVRADCIKRDKNRCQMPDCQSKKRAKKHVHHIERWSDAPSLRYEISNCILLCKACHDSIKDKEQHYAPLFRSILNERSRRSGKQ